jgi:hypothetical protein
MRAIFINEKFTEDSDPIEDMNIGYKHLIKKWLDEYNITSYIINDDDLTIDVEGDVYVNYKNIKKLPEYIQFNHIKGSFTMYECGLTTLKGFPKIVDYYFTCGSNKLTTLKYGPEKVFFDRSGLIEGHGYAANNNKLTSLEGLPKSINGTLWVHGNTKKFSVEEITRICDVRGRIEV